MRIIKVLLTFYCVSSVCNVFGQNLITSNNTLLKVGTHKLLETKYTDDNTEMDISNSSNTWMLNESKIDVRVNPLNDSPYLNHPGIPHNLLKINSEGSSLKYFTSIEGALTGYIDNQNLVSQAASFWINGQSRIDNKFLVNSGDQGDYKLQVGGGIWNDGIVHLAATAPVLSFQLGTGSESDYWIGRNTNELIRNSASTISDRIGGNSWYNGSIANGHRWFDGALSPGTLMQLKTDGELLLGSVADQGAYRLQMNTPVSGNGIYVDGSENAGSGYVFKSKDQAWAWHASNGIASIGLQNQFSGTAWALDAVNTKFTIIGRSADVTLTTDASGDIYIIPGRKFKMNLGSDATGDIYYRNSTGDFSRLAAGSDGQVLTVNSGLPTWAAGGSGSSQWTTQASDIYYNSGNVGIGTSTPTSKLHVEGTVHLNSNTTAQTPIVIDHNTNYGGGTDGVLIRGFTASSTWHHPLTVLSPNLVVGQRTFISIGKANSLYNRAHVGYYHNGSSTTDNHIGFGFWGVENLMTIKAGGNVQIGTNGVDAGYKLDVNGKQRISGSSVSWSDPVLYVEDTYTGSGSTHSGIVSWSPNLPSGSYHNGLTFGVGHSSFNEGMMSFKYNGANSNTNYISFSLFGVLDILTMAGTGNVGIGTNLPSAKLHTIGSVRLQGLTTNNTLTNILAADANGNLAWRDASTFSGSSSQWTTASTNIYYNTGSVGIGTANINHPDYKLFVEGAIRSRKVRVDQLTWPDYVFSDRYNLLSLPQVEAYIKENNHLPDVPSAKEVEKEGLDLGDNQAILLRKIEELTLYIIGLDKKIVEQGQEISELKRQNMEMPEIKKQLADLKKYKIQQ